MRRLFPAVLAAAFALSASGRSSPGWNEAARPALEPVVPPAASGPGPSPRNANYTIAVRLDPATRMLRGRETVAWRNTSRVTTPELRFHLYYNAWRDAGSTFFREAALAGERIGAVRDADRGWIDVTAIRLLPGTGDRTRDTGDAADLLPSRRFIAPDDGNADDRTVMSVRLPQPVGPDQTAVVDVEWAAQVPRTVARTGRVGDYYFLGQWFPKIAVLEDAGWNCHQFHASTEFFADYGVYDVAMTVPDGWIVGATGRLSEVNRQRSQASVTTWRYVAADVHDFAWTTSPDYVERRERFQEPGLPPVQMRLLLQPEHLTQAARHFAATRAALRDYGTWFGAYPYPEITIVDPAWQSGAGGMEYPTLFTAGTRWLAPEGAASPEHVTVHECGHQFWYALVGNNEFEDAWLDEGLNTYATARVMAEEYGDGNHATVRFFGGFVPFVLRDFPLDRVEDEGMARYRLVARAEIPDTPSWRYWPGSAGAISYSKTALWLHTLENHLGWPTLRRGLATYFDRWKFRHPRPADFFAVLNEASGRDLTWFFDQVYRDARVFDYGVQELRSAGIPGSSQLRTTAVVRRFADGVFPVDVVVRFADGSTAREHWDGRDAWKAFTYDRRAAAVSAEVDPERVLALDVNRANNSRLAAPSPESAASRWTAGWIVWLEDLMMACANFV